MDPNDRIARFSELHPEIISIPPRDRRPIAFTGSFAEIAAPVMLSHLSTFFDEIAPDLVVHEVAELGVTPIATSRGVRRVVVGYSGALPPPVLASTAEAVKAVWATVSLAVPDDVGLYSQDYLHPFAEPLGQRPASGVVRDFRPIAAEGIETIHDVQWLTRLGVDRPAAYITYGTEMGPLAPWPALLGALANIDVDAIVTTGNGVDLDPLLVEFDDATRSRIHVRDYVPQAAVLERASVVVSHGGAGTMLAAARTAIPQIVVPFGADQFDNADAFASAGVAVALDSSNLNADGFAEQLHAMLTNERARRAAIDLADHFASMPHPNEVVVNLL
jgi:UDP-N-acetylglucosamine transferase subunit ALG13